MDWQDWNGSSQDSGRTSAASPAATACRANAAAADTVVSHAATGNSTSLLPGATAGGGGAMDQGHGGNVRGPTPRTGVVQLGLKVC